MQNELAQYVHNFYKQLYVADLCLVRTKNFASIPWVVIEEMNWEPTKDFSLEELKKAIVVLSCGKMPRHDQLLMEFFQNTINDTWIDLLEVL